MASCRLIATTALTMLSFGCVSVDVGGANVGAAPLEPAGTPVHGGTLTYLGGSDIINLDTVSAYYPVSYLLERMFTRQLFGYPDSSNFTAETVVTPDAATVIPTISNGGISGDGKTYTIHIRPDVMWNTSPPRQVTSYDFEREFKMLCNPVSPTGAPGYFVTTILGMASYCKGFAKVSDTVAAISTYEEGTTLAGVSTPNASTIVFRLLEPASDFLNILALPFCSARPVEYMKYLPDSSAFRQNTLSDGPYQITSYSPGNGFTLDRNPAWKASTDSLRHAYVDKVVITEGLTSESVQEQLEAGTGDLEWNATPPTQDLPALAKSSDLVVGPPDGYFAVHELALNEYAGPFRSKLVREAAAYAVDKDAIVQIDGGPSIAAVANQLFLPGSVGYTLGYNPFPGNNGSGDVAMARSLLRQAGYQNGVSIKLVYSTTLVPMPRVAQFLQSDLSAAGFHVDLVPTTQPAFFGSYLVDPNASSRDEWDIAAPRWIPDWFGNNGRSTLVPLFTDPGNGSADYGGYSNTVTNSIISKALAAPIGNTGAALWSEAQHQVLGDVAAIAVDYQKWPIYHSSAVHGCTFWWVGYNCDPTNVWLSS